QVVAEVRSPRGESLQVFETGVDLLERVSAELPDHHGDDVRAASGERMSFDPAFSRLSRASMAGSGLAWGRRAKSPQTWRDCTASPRMMRCAAKLGSSQS